MIRRASPWVLLALAAACGSPGPPRIAAPLSYRPVPAAPDEPFRATPPPLAPLDPPRPLSLARVKLANGMEVILVDLPGLPIFSARLVIARGARDLRGTRPEMLDLGMAALSRQHRLGGEATAATCDADGCLLSTAGSSGALEASISVLAEIAAQPRYEKAWQSTGFSRDLERWSESPGAGTVDNNAAAMLFSPDDAYGPLKVGAEKEIAATPVTAVKEAHARLFQPEHATLVVAGDVRMERLQQVAQRVFEPWKQRGPALPRSFAPPVAAAAGPRAALIDHRGMLVHGYLLGSGPVPGDGDPARGAPRRGSCRPARAPRGRDGRRRPARRPEMARRGAAAPRAGGAGEIPDARLREDRDRPVRVALLARRAAEMRVGDR